MSVLDVKAARGKIQGERPVSADSRPSTAPEHAVQGARSGSLNGLFQSPAASPAPPAQAPSFVGSSLYSSEGFRFPNGVSQASAGSLSPFPGMTANRMAPISRPPALSQVLGGSSLCMSLMDSHCRTRAQSLLSIYRVMCDSRIAVSSEELLSCRWFSSLK